MRLQITLELEEISAVFDYTYEDNFTYVKV